MAERETITNARWRSTAGVHLDETGEFLVYGPERAPGSGEARSVTGRSSTLLRAFLDLHAIDEPEEIEAFARRWGLLWLCDHGLPRTHAGDPRRRALDFNRAELGDEEEPLCWRRAWLTNEYRESVAAWRKYAGQANAMISIAAHLNDGRPVPRADERWSTLDPLFWSPVRTILDRDETRMTGTATGSGERFVVERDTPVEHLVDQQRRVIAEAVQTWLSWGDVRPRFGWERSGPSGRSKPALRIDGQGLFGALAVQVMLHVANKEALVVCEECRVAYIPPERLRDGQLPYCDDPDCQRARKRDAVKRHREKIKREEADAARGLPMRRVDL